MKLLFLTLFSILIASCNRGPALGNLKEDQATDPAKHDSIVLGGGCFWCIEAVFQQLDGVISATSGYTGGHVPNPKYEDVTPGASGHIEVVKIVFDPKKISTEDILTWFWKAHDPTDPRGQEPDFGEPYKSHVFTNSAEQKALVEKSKSTEQKHRDKTIVTKIRELEIFYPAEDYHQDYYLKDQKKSWSDRNSYVKRIIKPKLRKLNLEY